MRKKNKLIAMRRIKSYMYHNKGKYDLVLSKCCVENEVCPYNPIPISDTFHFIDKKNYNNLYTVSIYIYPIEGADNPNLPIFITPGDPVVRLTRPSASFCVLPAMWFEKDQEVWDA